MHDRLHPLVGKMLLQFVPTVALRDEVHESMELVGLFFRQADRYAVQRFPVEGRIGQAQQVRSVQQAQQAPKDPLDPGDPWGLLEIPRKGEAASIGSGVVDVLEFRPSDR